MSAPAAPLFRLAVERVVRENPDAQVCALPLGERTLLGPRATPKRKVEFAAGRRAARAALALHDQTRSPRRPFVIIRTSGGERLGEPVVIDEASGAPAPDTRVSISHAGGIAVAVAASSPLGVDVTPVEGRSDAFARDAFLDGELAAWRALLSDDAGGDDPRAVSLAFAAKEAALKWQGIGFGAPLLGVSALPQPEARDARAVVVVDGVELTRVAVAVDIEGVATALSAFTGWLAGCALCVVSEAHQHDRRYRPRRGS